MMRVAWLRRAAAVRVCGLALALGLAQTGHGHPDGSNPADTPTNISVNFATGFVDYDFGHCTGTESVYYRFDRVGSWASEVRSGANSEITATAIADGTKDYVEVRMRATADSPHCTGGSSPFSSTISYARTTLSPAVVAAHDLHGATLTVTLGDGETTRTGAGSPETFTAAAALSHFTLFATGITGLSISAVSATAGGRTATLTLGYTGSTATTVAGSFTVAVAAAAHSGANALTSSPTAVGWPLVETVAGSGGNGFSGDGAAATAAAINNPYGVALDPAGNLYIADTSNHRIRKVDAATGNISTIAGTGTAGFSGDGAAATAAQLNSPRGVAVDRVGNLYISDTSNHRIRKVDAATGNISTIAGTGFGGFGGDGGAATSADLQNPWGVTLDHAGNLYIADLTNHRIRKLDAATGNISTVAGTGTSGFSGDSGAATSAMLSGPLGVALDRVGNLYIANIGDHRIRKVDAATGNISTVAGTGTAGFSGDGGAASAAELDSPYDVALDGAGNLYIADNQNRRIRKVDAATGNISTIAGTGTAGFNRDGAASTTQIHTPQSIVVDVLGNIYVADSGNHRVRRIRGAAAPTDVPSIETVAGTGTGGFSGDGGAATAANINNPGGVALDNAGNLYIAGQSSNRIRRVDASGNISTFAGTGTSGFGGDGGAATSAMLGAPGRIAADSAGNLYIADSGNNRIRRVDASGNISTFAGTGMNGFGGDGGAATSAQLAFPLGVALDGAGNLYIADYSNHAIRKVDAATGNISTFAGTGTGGFSGDGGAATAAGLNGPAGVALDGAGNLYIADFLNHLVRKVDAATGNISTIAGTGTGGFSGDGGAASSAQLNNPQDVALDGAGNLYITDAANHRIRKVDTSGNIRTIAGTGTGGFNADGVASYAQVNAPRAIAVDAASQYIYIADYANHRVRRISGVAEPRPPAPPSPVAPPGATPSAPPNLPPVATGTFEDAAMDPGERLEIPLAGKFRDPEGGALTYSAGTSNARVAEVGVSDGRLWVQGRSPGPARVFVRATDAGGLSASQYFLVQVGVVVSFAADASAPEGGALRLRLLASQPADEDLSVAYALIGTGDTASAANGFDHDGGSGGTATIAAGAMEAEIEIGILDDAQVEPLREFFALSLVPPAADAGYVLGFKTQALATIEEGVCDRAAPVRDALRGRDSCTAVADLSSLLVLNLAGSGAEALSTEDFLGLSGLQVLDLSRNRLSSWPSAVLAGLPNLISLRLNGNRLRELPAGALAAHPRLIGLHLAGNGLSALPPGVFRELAGLQYLDLSGNLLRSLPGDALAGLGELRGLRLDGNLLQALPAGLFEGVSGLRGLQLQGNPGAPFALTLELARTDGDAWAPGPASVAARVAEGAPFALRSVLLASGGALPEGVPLEIATGGVESAPATVPQGEANPIWARLDGAPPVPDEECGFNEVLFQPCFQGLATAVGSPLALFKRPPMSVGPVEPVALRVDGDALRLDLASQFEAAPEETLTYAAESSDPSVVRVRIDNGTLIAEAVGEGIATITIRATDGDGLSATLRFTVQADRTARSRWQGWRLILLQPQAADR